MKIAVNTRFLLEGKLEGLGWFTYETMKRMVENHPEHQFFFIFDRPYSQRFIFASNVTPIVAFPPARHPFLWFLWFEIAIPKVLRKINPDIFVSTDGYLSLRTKVKTIDVIHDLNFEHYPEQMKWLVKKYYRYFFPKFARKACRIVTVSEYSKQDIVSTYGIPASKIDVAYNGAGTTFKPLSEEEKIQIRKEYTNGSPYFVYVGALLPRKNIARLLEAFDQFKKQSGSNTKMVIVGAKMFKTKDIENVFNHMQFKHEVIFTGRLPEGKIEPVVGAALAMTYVSYFEGFGIPLIEAMYADVPVITSNKTALPEVAGKAAIIVDPFSVKEITDAMILINSDKKVRDLLITEGRIQRQKFNWDYTALTLWQSIEKCLQA